VSRDTRICENALTEEEDANVRQCAADGLGVCNSGANDPRIGRILSAIVKDESEDNRVRRAAYLSLYILTDKDLEFEHGTDLVALTESRIPEDVDWSFVDSFLQ
jgi:HEAT repeat protein